MSLTCEELGDIAEELGAGFLPAAATLHRPRWNIAPTDLHPIVRATAEAGHGRGRASRWLTFARWGFGVGAPPGTPIMINARSETAAVKPSFRDAPGGEQAGDEARVPFWIHRRDGRLLLMAGLHEAPPGQPDDRRRFTILTTVANAQLGRLHDRMPVILPPEQVDAWLRYGGHGLLRPAPEDWLALRPVSPRVNSVRNDDPACLAPHVPVPRRQLTLF
jgi:putative SOS response-associated peptidase YedK